MINLQDLVAKHFWPVYWAIKQGRYTYYDLYGGRGSTKSSFAALMIVLGMMADPELNAVVFRKVAGTLADSVYEQIKWAINKLDVEEFWHCTQNPVRCTYIPTGQRIIFRGLDDPAKIKSIKVAKGRWGFVWFEELDEFAGEAEIRKVLQSLLRGEEDDDFSLDELWADEEVYVGDSLFTVFRTFNPPVSASNWANQMVKEERPDALRLKSTFLDVPKKWLGKQFYRDAIHLMSKSKRLFDHEYMGEPVGTGTNVFELVETREITDEEARSYDRIYQGIDWGWSPDPFAFVRATYDRRRDEIIILDEIKAFRTSNAKTAQLIIDKGYTYTDYPIICDYHEPKSIDDFRLAGLAARESWAGGTLPTIRYGMKFLQGRTIVVDPNRTPHIYKEIIEYEYERNKDGEVLEGYPDKNNHFIDALRYAMEPHYRRGGNSA